MTLILSIGVGFKEFDAHRLTTAPRPPAVVLPEVRAELGAEGVVGAEEVEVEFCVRQCS